MQRKKYTKEVVLERFRMPVTSSPMERLFGLLDLAENPYVSEKVRETLLLLGSCFPLGDEKDDLGVSLDQIESICSLAGFDDLEVTVFVDTSREAGGLDANRASYLIATLGRQGVGLHHDQER